MSESDGSSSESGDEGSEGLGLQGYQFEPTIAVPPDDSSSDEEESAAQISGSGKIYLPTSSKKGRANNKTWSLCGVCKPVENDEACVCCHEQVDGGERIICKENCIVNMDGFPQLCLQPLVLENVLIGLHHSKGDPKKEPLNVNLRFAAYKQFIWWRYGYLGAGNRKIVPACATWKIRERFPEASGTYTPFKNE